ncbi:MULTISPECIES: GntR family transcriptional regulator [unclassified Ligilactobacillus]|uniref:GntR family transcriptional regulator n=1 Tax=unclassified Ligilactobacillus TaxID=2767920 RepID=UPI0038522DB7
MEFKFNTKEPLYRQIAHQLEEMIFVQELVEGEQVPSTTQLSQELSINPATVLKGMNLLVGAGLIEKRRGMGMFVCVGAYEKVMAQRQKSFYQDYVKGMLREAKKLHISKKSLLDMIERGNYDDEVNGK